MTVARPIRFTRFGTFYILFSLGVGAAAINTGNNLLYLILGILLGFIIVSGVLSDSGLWGLKSAWSLREEGYAGKPLIFDVRLRKGWFPSVAIEVSTDWDQMPVSKRLLYWIPSRGQLSVRWTAGTPRRGWLSLERVRYASRFPFGLFEKSHLDSRKDRWLIYPKVELLPTLEATTLGEARSEMAAHKIGLGSIPFSLRDYRMGDPAKRIHWKTSLRQQRLLVTEAEEESDPGDMFYISEWPSGWAPQAQEELISLCASIAYTYVKQGKPIGFQAPGFLAEPACSREQLHRILRYLALVDFSAPPMRSSNSVGGIDVLTLWKGGPLVTRIDPDPLTSEPVSPMRERPLPANNGGRNGY